jgi:hypothetical protein
VKGRRGKRSKQLPVDLNGDERLLEIEGGMTRSQYWSKLALDYFKNL